MAYKIKTNRAAAKRFSVTGTGKIKHKKRGMRHNLEHVKKNVKRGLRQTGYIADSDAKNVRELIPYK